MEQRSKADPVSDPACASDLALAAIEAAGDGAAFEVLMRRHNQVLYRTARSIVKDDAEAEDVVQEASLLAYRNAASFRGDAAMATWLTRIVVNEASGRLRKTRRRAGSGKMHCGSLRARRSNRAWRANRARRPRRRDRRARRHPEICSGGELEPECPHPTLSRKRERGKSSARG